MIAQIKFSKNFIETSLPLIRLTKSRNGKTGTATFLFIQPFLFFKSELLLEGIEKMILIYQKSKIITSDLKIYFHQGKPFLLKAIFLFKNANEWFLFLSFIRSYAKETGLSFDCLTNEA